MKKPLNEMLASDDEVKAYFDTLPRNTQEILVQSSVKINSLKELKDCVYNLREDYLG